MFDYVNDLWQKQMRKIFTYFFKKTCAYVVWMKILLLHIALPMWPNVPILSDLILKVDLIQTFIIHMSFKCLKSKVCIRIWNHGFWNAKLHIFQEFFEKLKVCIDTLNPVLIQWTKIQHVSMNPACIDTLNSVSILHYVYRHKMPLYRYKQRILASFKFSFLNWPLWLSFADFQTMKNIAS